MKPHYIIAALLAVATVYGCDNSSKSSSVTNEQQTVSDSIPSTASEQQSASTQLAYHYISPEDVAKAIRAKDKITVLDTVPKDKFDQQHITGAVPSYAYPAETDEQKALLKAAVEKIDPEHKIVIVCMRGKRGATNAINYLREIGVANDRLLILEGGATGWPADQLSDVTTVKK